MVRTKLIAAFLLVLAGLILVLQNTQPVEAKFLFMSVTILTVATAAGHRKRIRAENNG